MPPTGLSTWLAHQRAGSALAALQRLLPTEPFVVVKGVALCARYGWDPSEVPIADVDVRLGPASLRRVRERLRALPGGGPIVQDNPLYRNVVLELAGHHVDVEAWLGPPALTRWSVADLLARAVLAAVPGAEPFLVPETTDHALVLSLDLFKDGLSAPKPHGVRNALRLADEAGFDPHAYAARARWAGLHTVAHLVAQRLAPHSTRWAEVLRVLGPASSPRYARLHERTAEQADGATARVVRRIASDHLWRRLVAPCFGGALLLARAGQRVRAAREDKSTTRSA